MPYHVLNVVLHAINAWWLALILRQLWTERNGGRIVPRGAEWLAAGLFLVHPVCVESVAWITEQKNTLSTFFYLAAAWTYLRFAAGGRTATYLAASLLFFLALGAKTMCVTLPPALLVVAWWRQGGLQWRRDVRPLVPWFALAVAAGLLTAEVEGEWVGADLVVPEISPVQHALLAGRIFWFYLGKLLWPADLTFFYPLWDVAGESAGWWPYLVAALAMTAGLWAIGRRARGPLALWLLFGGTLFPVLGFFKVFAFQFSYVADHFHYLAIPVAMAAVAAGWLQVFGRLPVKLRPVGWALALGLGLVLGVMAHRQSRLYRDNETLFRANVSANPRSWMGHHVLAHTVGRSPERRAEAIALFREALRLKPANPDSLAALGALLVQQPGHREEAIALFGEAVRLRPTFAEAHNGLANELAAVPGRQMEALAHYREALRLRPRFGLARANLARALAQIPGQEDEALATFAQVLREMPGEAPAHFHYAELLARLPGHEAEALTHYEEALRCGPETGELHARWGGVLAGLGRWDEARLHFTRALVLEPTAAWIHYEFSRRLAGRPDGASEALAHAEEAGRLAPDLVEALNLQGVLHARLGRADAARAAWRRALEIRPGFEPVLRNLRLLDGAAQ